MSFLVLKDRKLTGQLDDLAGQGGHLLPLGVSGHGVHLLPLGLPNLCSHHLVQRFQLCGLKSTHMQLEYTESYSFDFTYFPRNFVPNLYLDSRLLQNYCLIN